MAMGALVVLLILVFAIIAANKQEKIDVGEDEDIDIDFEEKDAEETAVINELRYYDRLDTGEYDFDDNETASTDEPSKRPKDALKGRV
jgi:hypothetical protein